MMNSNELISVIIPIYNLENRISDTIESVVHQTHKRLQIILIDDGSVDNSYKICLEYAKKDERIIVIHQENRGVSAARNIGLLKAQGNWISFIDGGDYIEENYYEKVLRIADLLNVDIVCVGSKKEDANHIFTLESELESEVILTREQAIERFLKRKNMTIGVNDKIYCKNCVKDILFDEKITHNEDALFLYQAIKKATRIAVETENISYFYTFSETSVSRARFSKKQMSIIKVQEFIFKDAVISYPGLYQAALQNYVQSLIMCLSLAAKDNYTEREDILMICKKLKSKMIKYLLSDAAMGYKKLLLIACTNYEIFKKIVK